MQFRWIEWNLDHISEHGVDREEAEIVIEGAKKPFPRRMEEEKFMVWGPGRGGRLLQVIFVREQGDTAFVIHARPLTEVEKRRYRRGRRQ
jgi:uncharacterized DUF497 family protein